MPWVDAFETTWPDSEPSIVIRGQIYSIMDLYRDWKDAVRRGISESKLMILNDNKPLSQEDKIRIQNSPPIQHLSHPRSKFLDQLDPHPHDQAVDLMLPCHYDANTWPKYANLVIIYQALRKLPHKQSIVNSLRNMLSMPDLSSQTIFNSIGRLHNVEFNEAVYDELITRFFLYHLFENHVPPLPNPQDKISKWVTEMLPITLQEQHWQAIQFLGQGSYGIILLLEHKETKQRQAFKVFFASDSLAIEHMKTIIDMEYETQREWAKLGFAIQPFTRFDIGFTMEAARFTVAQFLAFLYRPSCRIQPKARHAHLMLLWQALRKQLNEMVQHDWCHGDMHNMNMMYFISDVEKANHSGKIRFIDLSLATRGWFHIRYDLSRFLFYLDQEEARHFFKQKMNQWFQHQCKQHQLSWTETIQGSTQEQQDWRPPTVAQK